MRRSPKPSTRAMILNRTLAALEQEMPDAELREEMAYLRRRALRVILPDHREAPRLVDLFPDLLALRAGAKA